MSQFIRYPSQTSGGGSSGSQTGVAYSVQYSSTITSDQGATIGSFTFYTQPATATLPGLVSSNAQTFAGIKTFGSSPVLASVTASSPLRTGASGDISVGSISLTNEVSGLLPRANGGTGSDGSSLTVGSVTLTSSSGGQAYALALPGSVSSGTTYLSLNGLGQTSWVSISSGGAAMTNGRMALWSVNLAGFQTIAGANAITVGVASNNISGVAALSMDSAQTIAAGTTAAPAYGLVDTQLGIYRSALNVLSVTSSGTQTLSVSNRGTTIIVGSLTASYLAVSSPVRTDATGAFTVGSITSNEVSGTFVQGNIPTTLNIGSITFSQTAGGATYPLTWPSAQGGTNTVPSNNGSGALSWTSVLTNPTSSLTIGSATISQQAGGAAYNFNLPISQGSSSSSVLTNNGAGNLSWVRIGEVVAVNSDIKTANATDNWHQLTGNSLNLTSGIWILSGAVRFGNNGGSPGYTDVSGGWYAANGGDNSTTPLTLGSASGLSVMSGYYPGTGGASGSNGGLPSGPAPGAGASSITIQTVYVRVTGTATVYAVSYSTQATSANSRITTYASAIRIA